MISFRYRKILVVITTALIIVISLATYYYSIYFAGRSIILTSRIRSIADSAPSSHKNNNIGIGLVACGAYAYQSIIEESLVHIRRYSDSVPIHIYTDIPLCFEGLDVNIISGGNCTTRFGSNMAKQRVLMDLLEKYNHALYLDTDVLVTKNFRNWLAHLPIVPKDTIVFAKERGGVASAISGGVMLLNQNSLRCLTELNKFMRHAILNEDSIDFDPHSDQKAYTRLVEDRNVGCQIGLMEPLTMCFSRDNDKRCKLNLVLTRLGYAYSNQTVFMHYTNEYHSQYKFEKKNGYSCHSLMGFFNFDCYVRIHEHKRSCAPNDAPIVL